MLDTRQIEAVAVAICCQEALERSQARVSLDVDARAEAFRAVITAGVTASELAEHLGITRPAVDHVLRRTAGTETVDA